MHSHKLIIPIPLKSRYGRLLTDSDELGAAIAAATGRNFVANNATLQMHGYIAQDEEADKNAKGDVVARRLIVTVVCYEPGDLAALEDKRAATLPCNAGPILAALANYKPTLTVG